MKNVFFFLISCKKKKKGSVLQICFCILLQATTFYLETERVNRNRNNEQKIPETERINRKFLLSR